MIINVFRDNRFGIGMGNGPLGKRFLGRGRWILQLLRDWWGYDER